MSYTKKIIIFSSVSFLIAVLLTALGVFPLLKNMYGVLDSILGIKRDLAIFENEVSKAEFFEQEYNDLEITPERVDQRLVNNSAPIELIKFFEDTASESGLLIDISPIAAAKRDKDPWDSIGFSIELIGEFTSSMKFLEKIENSPYFIEVFNFNAQLVTQRNVPARRYEEFLLGQIITTIELKAYTKNET